MKRRDFLTYPGLGVLAGLVAKTDVFAEVLLEDAASLDVPNTFNLTSPYRKEELAPLYNGVKGAAPAQQPPQMFLYYDKDAKPATFVNPADISPTLDPAKYELKAVLHAFNIAQSSYDSFSKLKHDLQLGLNVTAPVDGGQDKLTWLFMSAIDVFLQKSKDVPAQLSKFKDYKPTEGLKPSSKVTISEGVVDLQVTAFGQRKDSFWKKLFDVFSKIANSPLIAAFAIPSLVKESVDFVDKSLDVFANQDKLVPVWQTHPLTFAVDKSAKNQDYGLKPGYWITIDSAFAKQNDYLVKGFSVDIRGQSFQIVADSGKATSPIDANYLVTSLEFAKPQSK